MIGEFASRNGELIPIAKAVIPIDNLELTYGFGVYETLKIRKGKLYFLEDHAERLLSSAKHIDLDHAHSKEQVMKWIEELVTANKLESANIKVLLLGAKKKESAQLHIFMLNPLYVEKKEYREGVHVTSIEYERFAPQAKSLNMLPSYLAYRQAKQAGAYECLLINRNGMVMEGTKSNFFAIKNKTLYTAPTDHCLDGITRRTIIQCARDAGYTVEEVLIPFEDLMKYDGAFVSNTSHKIVPIRSIDDERFDTIAPALSELQRLYSTFLDQQ